jgi:uncharacterized protein YraI
MKRWFENSRLQSYLSVALLAVLVLAGLSVSSSRAAAQGSPWEAKYWNNRTLSGEPVLVRQEDSINWDWGSGSPAAQVLSDNFSAQWRQTVSLAAGTYRFTATMDDGMRVWVNNTVIIDQWFDSQVRTVTADVYLGAGTHTIQVQYYEAGGSAVAKMSYAIVSAPPPPPTNAWRGEFFNNTTLAGTPVLVADSANINFNWGFGSPGSGVQTDNFSARWNRTSTLEAGKYRFTVVSDDGVRLWVNNTMVLDQWKVQSATTYVVDVDLPGGQTAMRLEYFEATERAQVKLEAVRISGGTTPPPTGAWRAEYFNNTSLAGAPVVTRDEAAINYNWGLGSPAPQIQADNFSARWTTTISTSNARYRFSATTDDGVRVWVNDRMIIDAWFDRPAATFTGEIDLAAGTANVRVEYYERVNLAEARVSYQVVSDGGTGGQFPGTATVIAYYLNVRSGPGVEFPVVYKLSRGQVVALTGFRNQAATWIQIVTPNGGTGWVNASYTTTSVPVSSLTPIGGTTTPPPPPPPSTGVTGTVTSSYLNVRTGPSTAFPAFTSIRNGTVVPLIGRDATSTWVKGILADGRQGWMSAFYMNFNTGIGNLPVLTR